MYADWRRVERAIHCRIGSSEIEHMHVAHGHRIHCRIGSSETGLLPDIVERLIHCRIGSSEIEVTGDRRASALA